MPAIPPAPLFGRDSELREMHRLLEQDGVRLLTLTGPGGTGKTRLAQELAAHSSPPDRQVHLVDLAVVDDPADVPASIARALGVQESGSKSVDAILRDVLGRGAVLLVLDNFERVMAAARLVADLLGAIPELACLVTSREPLHIRAERVLPVGPLPVPPAEVSDLTALASIPSVALFLDRATARTPGFRVTLDNSAAIAEICRQLDGLPLAIELAAAQLAVLPPSTILARLTARDPFVLEGPRDMPDRHRTLRAAVAWSYDLLDSTEQATFLRCGVFSGSFATPAVVALGATSDKGSDVLETLARLANKSLIRVAEPVGHDEPRFQILETIRGFALDVLVERAELTDLRKRHAAYFLTLAEAAEEHLVGPEMGTTLDRLERDYDNLRAVLHWALDSGDVATGLRLAGALHRFWMLRGHLAEARQWLDRALPRGQTLPVEVQAKAFNAAGVLAGIQGDNTAAETFFHQSLRLWRTLGAPIPMAAVLGNLGLVAQDRQNVERALAYFTEAETLYSLGGDRRGMAVSVGCRARLARQQGSIGEAVTLFEEALALFREVDDPRGIANSLANLGLGLVALQQPQRSMRHFQEALELRRSLGDTLGIAECLEGFAAAAAAVGRARRAARLLGAAEALHELTGAPLAETDREQYNDVLRRIHAHLSPATFEREKAAGRLLAPHQAADYALVREEESGKDGNSPHGSNSAGLSPRELEVARLVARGLTNQQIADSLLLSRRTVGTHIEHIFTKLRVRARAEVAVWVTRHVSQEPAS